ncbi:glutathione peroxidase [Flavihumibacter fluvii]|uniref:glutathione peroxidase n=1 Tax=Flavihumibacter fluvii TaxID=2838157 RepID=UPI001BDEF846|nr:glutathione peroxidase [Flavihumibacter fluvii]ULQ52281.1 glutathione peroxidase [Flavihumibacter fluvii]
MSVRQQLLQWIYPTLIKAGKLFGSENKVLVNQQSVRPIESLYNLVISLNDGSKLSMATLKGKKILLVNTASDCGYTAQYEELQELSEQYNKNLVVIAFPANDFKEQEKGDDASIAQFCKKNYGVSFPLSKKTSVIKSNQQDPVFHWLSDHRLNGWCDRDPEWNFSKYLVDENGTLTHYFPAAISPLDPIVTKFIQANTDK